MIPEPHTKLGTTDQVGVEGGQYTRKRCSALGQIGFLTPPIIPALSTFSLPSWSHTLHRLGVAFDDLHAVASAGLLLPATLGQHLQLREVVEYHVDLGEAYVGHKAVTLIHAMLAGRDSIDAADVLQARATQTVLGHAVLAPSTLGTFLRSLTFGHVRPLDAVGREALRRAWAAGQGPGDRDLTRDLDFTICGVS